MPCPDGKFDEIVSGFYRAAHAGLAWPEALEPLKRAMGASLVRLDAFDRARQMLVFSYGARSDGAPAMPAADGFNPLRGYYCADPQAAQLLTLAPGHWLSCPQHFSGASPAPVATTARRATRNGQAHAAKIMENDSLMVVLGLLHADDATPPTEARLSTRGRLSRHLAEAVKMHVAGRETLRTTHLAAELLSPLRAPVAIVDAQRRIVHRNPAAECLLGRTRVLTQAQGRLGCRRQEDNIALDTLLHEVLTVNYRGQSFLNARGTDCQTSCGLYLHALRRSREPDRPEAEALVMVLLHETATRIDVDPHLLAARYELTQAEARVGAALAGGLTPEAIAETHGVAITTVRSQLRGLLKKTGVTRQTELMGVLAGLSQSSPGLGPSRTPGALRPVVRG
jgi:DNA-binding CsgD family transcriptional regulator